MNTAILIVRTHPPADMEEEFNAWYDREHLPERLAVPGFERARRYSLIGAERRYLALYDVRAPEVFESPAYLATSGPNNTPWTKRIIERCNFVRVTAVQAAPGTAFTGPAPRLAMWRFADAAADLQEITAASRSAFETDVVRQWRVFTAQESADVYVLVEGSLGLETVLRTNLYGAAERLIDSAGLYMRY